MFTTITTIARRESSTTLMVDRITARRRLRLNESGGAVDSIVVYIGVRAEGGCVVSGSSGSGNLIIPDNVMLLSVSACRYCIQVIVFNDISANT